MGLLALSLATLTLTASNHFRCCQLPWPYPWGKCQFQPVIPSNGSILKCMMCGNRSVSLARPAKQMIGPTCGANDHLCCRYFPQFSTRRRYGEGGHDGSATGHVTGTIGIVLCGVYWQQFLFDGLVVPRVNVENFGGHPWFE